MREKILLIVCSGLGRANLKSVSKRNLNIEDSELVLDTTIENPPPVFLVKKNIYISECE